MGQAAGKSQLGAREASYSGPGELFAAAVEDYSVFVLRTDVADERNRAETYESKLKTVRSPDILRFKKAVSASPDKRWLVTERVVPLESIKETLSYAQLVLAMHRVTRALHFMHTQCRLSHNAVCLAAVFVHCERDDCLSFRLGGLHACDTVPCAGSSLSPYPEPPEGPVPRAKAQSLPIHSRDVWHLGFLLQQLLESSEARAASVNALCKAMRNPEPTLRPTCADILQFPFFEGDLCIRIVTFLEQWRGTSLDERNSFFAEMPGLLQALSADARDLRHTIAPLLCQAHVMQDGSGAEFWGSLFDAYPGSAASQAVVAHVLHMLGHRDRSLRAAAMSKMEPLLAALQREEGQVAAKMPWLVAEVVRCFGDTDRQLNVTALGALLVLCKFWVAVHDGAALPRINAELLPVLASLGANDRDPYVRAEVARVTSSLFLLYSGINGVAAVNIMLRALLDADDGVQVAAMRALTAVQALLPSVLVVHAVLPGLVKLLLSRNDAVRQAASRLMRTLVTAVAAAKDVASWPAAVPGLVAPDPRHDALNKGHIFVGSCYREAAVAAPSPSERASGVQPWVSSAAAAAAAPSPAPPPPSDHQGSDPESSADEGAAEDAAEDGVGGDEHDASASIFAQQHGRNRQLSVVKVKMEWGDSTDDGRNLRVSRFKPGGLFQGLVVAPEARTSAAAAAPAPKGWGSVSLAGGDDVAAAAQDVATPAPTHDDAGAQRARQPPQLRPPTQPTQQQDVKQQQPKQPPQEQQQQQEQPKPQLAAAKPAVAEAPPGLDDLFKKRRSSSSSDDGARARQVAAAWVPPVVSDDDDDDDDDDDGGGGGPPKPSFDAWKTVNKAPSSSVVSPRQRSPRAEEQDEIFGVTQPQAGQRPAQATKSDRVTVATKKPEPPPHPPKQPVVAVALDAAAMLGGVDADEGGGWDDGALALNALEEQPPRSQEAARGPDPNDWDKASGGADGWGEFDELDLR